MRKQKQIEIPSDEMGTSGYSKLAWKIWQQVKLPMAECEKIDRLVREQGYRKQSDGKWQFHRDGSGTCSECHFTQRRVWDYDNHQRFCGVCGAKMKGGAR